MLPSGKITKAGALVGVVAATFIASFEGVKYIPYLDIVSVPTVCAGHTKLVDMGKVYTKAECFDLLASDVQSSVDALDRLVKVPLNKNQTVAFTSFIFNVGEGAFAKSTMLKLLNQGKYKEACKQLPRWANAGGKWVKGLARRRDAEMQLCLMPDDTTESLPA